MAISIKESVITGFSDFWSRKIRSIVTIFGITLGTMSVIMVMALANGIKKSTLEWMMERGGLSKITIRRNWEYQSPTNQKKFFTLKEIELIRSLTPQALYFNPQIRSHKAAKYEQKEYWGPVYGVLPDFKYIEEWDVSEGRFISEFDIDRANDVIVIGTMLKDELFGSKDPIGEFITYGTRRLKVIGIMEFRYMKSQGNIMQDNALNYLNRRSYIPLSTLVSKITGEDNIGSLTVKAVNAESAPDLRRRLEAVILNMRRGEPVFFIESAQETAKEMEKNAAKFQIIFFFISAISLLVGGIVIANIMLASVQERTREIGIRLAVGARKRDIFVQFLVQTVLVTTIGGVVGVIAGISLLDVVGKYLEVDLIAGAVMVAVAVIVSAGVGFIAGIVPAVIASKLNPVEALRYE
jgi:putative ABC transport system permease protein